jgi:2-polyprenyl-3-methyl-5-hydroxy-6-metoxy-1,4-benzoquinol methylase
MQKKWSNHLGELLTNRDGIDVIECECCGFAHIIPLPQVADKEEFYRNQFYETFSDDYIKKHEEDKTWWSIEHNEKYDKFEELLEDTKTRKSLLDIGSGPGYFLKTGADRSWNVQGIEPGISAWQYSHDVLGLNVHHTFLKTENAGTLGTFDVVHMNNVLEHIVNATELLSIAHGIINKGGMISVTVPNDFNRFQEIVSDYLEKGEWWVSPLQHINYFNCQSLENLLIKTGFDPIYKTTSFPMELFLLMGDDYIDNAEIGRKLHAKRKLLELNMDKSGNTALKRQLYDIFAGIGLGRQVTVMARK